MAKHGTTHDAHEMDAEVRRRLELPLERWELVKNSAEFTSEARAYLDDLDVEKGGAMDDAERKIDEMTAELRARFENEFGDPAELLAEPSLQRVLNALNPDYSQLQKAVWLVAPCEDLDDEMPLKVVQNGEIDRVVLAARQARDITIG